jgi:hypothetical protein
VPLAHAKEVEGSRRKSKETEQKQERRKKKEEEGRRRKKQKQKEAGHIRNHDFIDVNSLIS